MSLNNYIKMLHNKNMDSYLLEPITQIDINSLISLIINMKYDKKI